MSVRSKAALLVVATCVGLLAGSVVVSRVVVAAGFTKIEDEAARDQLKRVTSELRDREQNLTVAVRDWSNWDDTYEFMKTRDPEYVESNLTDEGIKNLGLHAMVFMDDRGRVLAAKGVDENGKASAALPDGLLEEIREQVSSSDEKVRTEDASGVALLPDGLFLFASLPVHTSQGGGESRGTVSWGYFLDDEAVGDIARKTGGGVTLQRWDRVPESPSVRRARSGLRSPAVQIDRVSEDEIVAHSVLSDVSGQPVAIVSAQMPREVARQARVTEGYTLAGLALATVSFGLVVILLLDKLVLGRLVELSSAVGRVGRGESDARAISAAGGDEVSSLAATISGTLDALSRSQRELAASEERFKGIADFAHDAIIVVDGGGVIEFWNPAAESLFGRPAEEVTGKLTVDNVMPDGRSGGRIEDLLTSESDEGEGEGDTGRHAFESFALRKDGTSFPVEVTISRVHLSERVMVEAIVRDISERRAFDEVQRMYRHDDLTDLPNRVLFSELARKSAALLARSAQGMALHLIDIDHFKEVNEGLGPNSGDALIRAMAKRLKELVRTSDTVARWGGDEFAVLQTDLADENHAGLFAQKLLDELSEPFRFAGQEIHVTVSIGVVVYPLGGPEETFRADLFDPMQMLREADVALYRAKDEGRNTFRFYNESMGVAVMERMTITQELRVAIEAGHLFLNYQPQVDIHDGSLIGAEALVRWLHPERGVVPPDHFIPAAEASGLILPLGEWVMEEACRASLAMEAAGVLIPRMGVNLSAVQFRRQDMVDMVARILAATGLESTRLEVELTEGVVVKNSLVVSRALQGLHSMGVDIAMDDFGTGYSSLSYLQTFHFDRLKIDRSFVTDCVDDPGAGKIVDTIVHLGHELGLKVIAEGVETMPQLMRLKKAGCDQIQGYLTGRPLPLEELVAKANAGEFGPLLVGARPGDGAGDGSGDGDGDGGGPSDGAGNGAGDADLGEVFAGSD